MKNVRISVAAIKISAIFYLALPIIIFYFGWLKIYYAVLFATLLAVALAFAIKRVIKEREGRVLEIPVTGAVVILIILLWVYLSGIGGFVWQRADWNARNAVLHDLINYEWPVVFEDGSGLTYYVCYWMIPALAGKIFGWKAAGNTLFLWTVIGLFITVLLLSSFFKDDRDTVGLRRISVILTFFILWGGLNVIGQFLVFIKGNGTMALDSIYGWSAYQYTPNNALLEWVFNQAVPAWVGAALYIDSREKGEVSLNCLILMLLVPFTPFAALGALPLFLTDIVKCRCKGLISVPNIASVCSVFPVFAAYFTCNNSIGEENALDSIGIFWLSTRSVPYNFVVLVVFLVVEVGIYIILIWKPNHHDYFFVAVSIWLLLIPLIRVGHDGDRNFLMRGSIIPLFFLMTYVLRTLLDVKFKEKKVLYAMLLLSVIIGFYSGVGDIVLTIKNTMDPSIVNTADRVKSMNNHADEEWNAYMNGTSYVVNAAGETFFFGRLAR